MLQQIREYQIIEKLGEGGMGVVYKAYDPNLERNVAIKGIHSTFTSNDDLVARFKQEARLQATLAHPNIVSLYNFFMEDGIYYMVMEYVEGETLSQRIKRVGLIPPHKCIPMFIQMMEGVGYAHQKGVIHRDIKPSNILIGKNDNIKIMDFGIAKITGEKGLTKTGTKIGTISYMSPEQVMAEKDIDERSDIFSLAITFFEMLTGQLPYKVETESDFKMMQQIVNNNLPSVKKYYPYVPDKVDEAIAKATKKDRNARFSSCKEFIDYIKFEGISEQAESVKKEITFSPVVTQSAAKEKVYDFDIQKSAPPATNFELSKEFPKASVGKRFGAFLLDAVILFMPILILALLISSSESDSEGHAIIRLVSIITLIIALFKDGLRGGKGIAKGIVGLRIVNEEGDPISIGKVILRTILTAIFYTFYGIGVIVDVIMIFYTEKGQKLADKILGTQVVNEQDFIILNKKVSLNKIYIE